MAPTQIFILVVLALASDAFKWQNCENKAPIRIHELSLDPHPLVLRRGVRVTFGGKFRVARSAGRNYKVDLTVWRKGGFVGWIKMPCLGHCTHFIGCNQLVGLLEGASCPLEKGHYEIKKQTHAMPDIPIPSFLRSGRYKVRADLTDKESKRRISCLETEVDTEG